MLLGVSDPLFRNIITTRSDYVGIILPKVYSKKRLLKGYSKSFERSVSVLDILILRVIGPLSKNYHPALLYGAITLLKRPTLSCGLHVDPRNTDVQWT